MKKATSHGCFDPLNFKHAFSPQEDEKLRRLVAIYGDKEWKLVAQKMPNRTTRQCRERYKSYLAPDIKNGPWTPEEDELLRQKYKEYGSKWSIIQSFFASRSDVNIKNRWTIISGKMNKEHKIRAYLIKTDAPIIASNSIENDHNPNGNNNGSNNTPSTITVDNNIKAKSNSTSNNIFNLQLVSPLSIQQNKIKVLNQPKSPAISPISPSSPSILVQVTPPGISTQIRAPCISHQIRNSINDQITQVYCNQNIPISHISTNPSESPVHVFSSLQQPIHFSYTNSNLPQYKKQKQSLNESINDTSILPSEINNDKDKPPVMKRKPFPPISSLSIPSDNKLMIMDRLFLPNETRIDELIISSGPNLTLANNFLHYGGNIW